MLHARDAPCTSPSALLSRPLPCPAACPRTRPPSVQVSKATVPYSSIERQMAQETASLLAVFVAPFSLLLSAAAFACGRLPMLARSTAGSVFAGLQVVTGVAGLLAVGWLAVVALQNLVQTGRD